MTQRFLGRTQVATRLGLEKNTIGSYLNKGMLPPPDAIIGEGRAAVSGWLPETIDAWDASRPGKGGRPRKKED